MLNGLYNSSISDEYHIQTLETSFEDTFGSRTTTNLPMRMGEDPVVDLRISTVCSHNYETFDF